MATSLYLQVTTCKKKIGLLLIEVFSKPFNPNNDGHLEQFWVAIYYLSGSVINSHFI